MGGDGMMDANAATAGLSEPLLAKEESSAVAAGAGAGTDAERESSSAAGGGLAATVDGGAQVAVGEGGRIVDPESGAEGAPREGVDDAHLVEYAGGSARQIAQSSGAAVPAARDAFLPRWFLDLWSRRNDEAWRVVGFRALKFAAFVLCITVPAVATKMYDWRHFWEWFDYDPSRLPPAVTRIERIESCAALLSGGGSHFDDVDSPQMRAVRWFISGGGRRAAPPATAAACRAGSAFAALYALVVLKEALGVDNATAPFWGDDAADVAGLEDVCRGARRWHRVGCGAAGGEVVSLNLAGAALRGTIPREVRLLPTLRRIEMYDNPGIGGVIPPELGDLPNLERLELLNTSLGGTIPPALGGLSKLQVLFLEKTNLKGTMPEEVCRLRTSPAGGVGALEQLHADCGGKNPRVVCSCCDVCRELHA